MTLVWRPGYGGAAVSDPDAMAYLRAVEEADNQPLEQGVQQAVNQFVIGCKNDGIWDAIKASCILAGARTLSGALVPLVGTAPTSYNFVAGDYNRETGLVGDGSTKYLDSNRAANASPQNNSHLSVYVSSLPSSPSALIGVGVADAGAYHITNIDSRHNASTASAFSASQGFIGISRASSGSYTLVNNKLVASISIASNGVQSVNHNVFRRTGSTSDARLAFYSIGESLDLAALDTRVSTLITAIGAAIP